MVLGDQNMSALSLQLRWTVIVSSIFVIVAFARAEVIISNLPGNDGTSTFINAPLGGSNGGGVFNSKAAGFTLPFLTVPYRLDFVTLRLEFFSQVSHPIVHIYSNVNNNPGAILHTLQPPAPTVGIDNFNFISNGSFQMESLTTYWMVVWNDTTVANSFRWLASSPSLTPTGIATSAGYRFNNGPPPPTTNSTTFNTYSVNATAVPEPATLVVLAAGALAAIRRRVLRRS